MYKSVVLLSIFTFETKFVAIKSQRGKSSPYYLLCQQKAGVLVYKYERRFYDILVPIVSKKVLLTGTNIDHDKFHI